jgi:serine phosphatase RsbU (regulator of sigma subunit)
MRASSGSWTTRLRGADLPLIAVAVGLIVMAIGGRVEVAIISAVGATGHRLEWISDVIAAGAVSSMTYLWLNLRVSQLRLMDLERAQIARNEQLRLGAEIQQSLLPAIPRSMSGYEWSARMETASEVGGDFYDYVVRDDGTTVVILGDVSGKGIPAALLQSSLQALFRVHAMSEGEPAAIAARISENLHAQTAGRPYATAIIARFDLRRPRITYTNAGHPAGLVWRRSGASFELTTGGPPLGLLPMPRYEQRTLDLLPGDAGVFMTDGVTEVLSESAGPLESPTVLAKDFECASPADVCDRLLARVKSASASGARLAPPDDRTVFAFRVTADPLPSRQSETLANTAA